MFADAAVVVVVLSVFCLFSLSLSLSSSSTSLSFSSCTFSSWIIVAIVWGVGAPPSVTVVRKNFSSSFCFLILPQNLLVPWSHCFIIRRLVRKELTSTRAVNTGCPGPICAGRRNLVLLPRCCFTLSEHRLYWSTTSELIGILSHMN